MKLRNFFYMLLALPVMLASCEEEPAVEPQPTPTPEAPKLTLTSSSDVYVNAEGGEGTITYTLENAVEGTELTATANVEWISVTTGETIAYTVAANENSAIRSGVITVAYGEANFTVSIKQLAAEAKDPVLTLTSEATMEFTSAGGVGEITYTLENPMGTAEVTASVSADASSWITDVVVSENNVMFAVAQNTEEAREGVITVAYATKSFTVTVKQAENLEPTIAIESRTMVSIPTAGGTDYTFRYSLKNASDAVSVQVTADVEWITIGEIGEETVTYSVDANNGSAREGHITATYGNSTGVITVSQAGIAAMKIVDIKASYNTYYAGAWDLVITEENDGTHGEMHTRITFQVADEDAVRIPDGTYSVVNGGILVNSDAANKRSEYRFDNSSLAEDIIAANLTITNNKETETTTITGDFTVGSGTIAIEWNGYISGFAYQDAEDMDDQGETEWNKVYTWGTNGEYMDIYCFGKHISEIRLFLVKKGKKSGLAAGVFPVGSSDKVDACIAGSSYVGNYDIVAGEVTLEEHEEGWKLTFDVTDAKGKNWKGTYIGPLLTKAEVEG